MNSKKKHATETERQRDRETERRRDGERKRRRRPPDSPSPRLSVCMSACLCGVLAVALSFTSACSEAPVQSSGDGLSSRPSALTEDEPEPPRVYLNTTYTPPKGNTIEVKAGGDFQAALNRARPGDVITLQAGATFTGNFTLPNKSGSGQSGQSEWIVIRSSTD